jgi:hypothetical protein
MQTSSSALSGPFAVASKLSDDTLLASLTTLLASGRRLLVQVVAYLGEVEERRLHLGMACSSMFDFCQKKLGMSEGEAYRRITAARLATRFPSVLDALADGRIHLSSLVLLRDHLTAENVDELLTAASGKTKREVQELLAARSPRPDVPTTIVPLGGGTLPVLVEPLAPERYKVAFTASAELVRKLELAKELLGHRSPSGDGALPAVVERALDALIAQLENAKLGAISRAAPSPPPPSAKPAHVSRAIRREVFARDGRQCSFVGTDGQRCSSRAFLELDHVRPRALGGTGESANVRVLCRAHNRYAAEQAFGRDHVEARIAEKRMNAQPRRAPLAPAPVPVAPVDGPRKQIEQALRFLGFRANEATRALAAMPPSSWGRPLPELLRDALRQLS